MYLDIYPDQMTFVRPRTHGIKAIVDPPDTHLLHVMISRVTSDATPTFSPKEVFTVQACDDNK